MHRDSVLVAGFLRVEEAEMLSELLESQGIEACVEGAVASCLAPALPGAGGGARLLVPAADADRAREVIATSGVFRGGDGPAVEIPEEEWARPPSGGLAAARRGTDPSCRKTFLFYPVLVFVLVAAATALCLLAGR